MFQPAEMANPEQQGLKRFMGCEHRSTLHLPKWLIQNNKDWNPRSPDPCRTGWPAEMANPEQQGLKPKAKSLDELREMSKWLIQYNKDWNPRSPDPCRTGWPAEMANPEVIIHLPPLEKGGWRGISHQRRDSNPPSPPFAKGLSLPKTWQLTC